MRPHHRGALVGLAFLAATGGLFAVNAADGDFRVLLPSAGESIADVRCDSDNSIGQVKSLPDGGAIYPSCAGNLYVTKWYSPLWNGEERTFPTAALQPRFDPRAWAQGRPVMEFGDRARGMQHD